MFRPNLWIWSWIHKPPVDSPFLRAVASVLFAAACAWALAHFMYRADERSAVCTAVRCTVSEDVALEGVVIRSEQLLRSDPAPGVSAVPGERLAADSAVAFAGDEPVMTRRSAVFFDDTDGYEYLSPGALTGLTSGGLEELLRARPETASDAYGRLVTGFDWYYAAAPAQDAPELRPGRCLIAFDGFDEALDARIVSSAPGALVIRLTGGANRYMHLRFCRARLITGSRTGLKLPITAVGTDGGGNSFVYCCTASGLKPETVEIIYSSEDFCLVAGDGALRDGSRVLRHWRDKENDDS